MFWTIIIYTGLGVILFVVGIYVVGFLKNLWNYLFGKHPIETIMEQANQRMEKSALENQPRREDQRKEEGLRFKHNEVRRLGETVKLFKKEQLLKQEVVDFVNKNPHLFENLRRS